METLLRLYFEDARKMEAVPDGTVALVVTSPPYPMIAMWDEAFCSLNPEIEKHFQNNDGEALFESMHRELDIVWKEVYRVLVEGGIACINVGDATRSVDGSFALFPNHSRVLSSLSGTGFTVLPAILWRKPTNSPTKFMGSGMYPAGAYVTLEHEYVLIVRKGGKRSFASLAEKENRRGSAFFWEERNRWFSDVWLDLIGTGQRLFDSSTRQRSGGFPFELPYRLILMHSVYGDTVLDPFSGLGTTLFAAMAAGRNSIGYEIDDRFGGVIRSKIESQVEYANRRIESRIEDHLNFVEKRLSQGKPCRYVNEHHGFPVVTRQETDLKLFPLQSVDIIDEQTFRALYSDSPMDSKPRAAS